MHPKYQFCGTKLLEKVGRDATLGEIAYATRGDWNATEVRIATNRPPDPNVYRRCLWRAYDEAFGSRPDYSLWRQEYRGLYYPERLRKPTLDLVHSGLEASPIVIWGTLSAVAGVLGSWRQGRYIDETVEMAALCSNRIADQSLREPQGTQYACTAIRLLLESALDRAWFEGNGCRPHTSVAIIDGFLNRIEALVKQLDPDWSPGRTVTIDGLYEKRLAKGAEKRIADGTRTDSRPLLPLRKIDLARCLRNVFYRARGAVRDVARVQPEIGPDVIALFQRGFMFAKSAWLSARSLRRAEELRVEAESTWEPNIPLDQLWREDVQALRRAVIAATEAGRHATAAVLCHNALWTVPDEREGERWAWFNPDHYAFNVRQFGLEVPERFKRQPKPRFKLLRAEGHASVDGMIPVVPTEELLHSTADVEEQDGPDTVRMRMAGEQGEGDWWATIRSATPEHPAKYDSIRALGFFVHCAHGNRIADQTALRAGFHLCLKYKRLADAGRLLDTRRIALSRSEAFAYAEAIAAAGTLLPWAVDLSMHRQWQAILRRSWGECCDGSVQPPFVTPLGSIDFAPSCSASSLDRPGRRYY